jgi:putative intracellular protease/amidase
MKATRWRRKRRKKYFERRTVIGKAWMAVSSHVVEDGLLITGQNPASAAGVGEAVVKKLKQGE